MADPQRSHPPLGRGKKLLFSVVTLVFFLTVADAAIRVSGVAETCKNESTTNAIWLCDPLLFFKLNPSLAEVGMTINRAGFRSPEFTPNSPDVYQILSLGDSCTLGVITSTVFNFVPEPYPQRLERMVTERTGSRKVEALNAGVAGYNSYHGVMLLRTKLRGLSPDLITVRFGWNDHLMSLGGQHGRTYKEQENPLARGVEDLLLRTSLYPFAWTMAMNYTAWRQPQGKPQVAKVPSVWQPDVPLDRYKRNLRRIVELGRARGAEVWLLTAPHAPDTPQIAAQYEAVPKGMAKTMITFSAIPTFERMIEIHESYNDAVRAVGRELNAPVVDLDHRYDHAPFVDLFNEYDPAHPTQKGHDIDAAVLYDRLVDEGVVAPGEATNS